jgi:hypothetical protein
MATQWTAGLTSGATLSANTLNTIGAAWVDYTPTLTQGVTVTKTISIARYCQIQKTIFVSLFLSATTAGLVTGVEIGLPIAAKYNSAMMGSGFIYDASTNTMYNVLPYTVSTSTVSAFYQTGSNWGSSPGIALAAGDQIRFNFTYEAA